MKRLTYLLAIIFIYPISLLPFWMLYGVSDILYFILYRVVGYRRRVTRTNLTNSFPEKTLTEIKEIERQFYRHLSDVIVEAMKAYTVRMGAIAERMPIKNPEVFENHFQAGESIFVVTGHLGNWEWAALSTCLFSPFPINQAVYRPLSNPSFDRRLKRNRAKFGLSMIPDLELARVIRSQKSGLSVTVLLADQSPPDPKRAYWTTFLNQDTGYNPMVERLVRLTDRPLIFGEIKKIKRGRYEIWLHDAPPLEEENAITEWQMWMLEKFIQKNPAYWLWSHRRWKHKRG